MATDIQILNSFSNERLKLIILPTEKCNFRCTYCFEDFVQGKMKENIISSIEKLISKRINDLKYFEICWYGGEPLLASEIIKRINSHTISEIAKNNSATIFNSDITTNGYSLNIKLATELSNLGVQSYQISLDGSKEYHDKTRIKANGQGTFEKIWNNLLELKNSNLNFLITIRYHINEDNFEHSFNFIKQIESVFLCDSRFELFVKAIGRYGGKNDNKINPLDENHENLLKQSIERYSNSNNLGESYICYASRPNSFVIRANGSINKCTVALYDEINSIGNILDSGELSIKPELAKLWSFGFLTNDEKYLGCPMSQLKKTEKLLPTRVLQ